MVYIKSLFCISGGSIIILLNVLMTGPLEKSTTLYVLNSSVTEVRTQDVNDSWPTPDTITFGIPVYKSFKSLEPIFQFDNDTTYLINFWATWCKPCIEEIPVFERVNTEYKNEPVKVVLVSLDLPNQVESKLVPFISKNQLKSKVIVLLDGKYNDWIDKVSRNWTGAIPATLIYKKDQNRNL